MTTLPLTVLLHEGPIARAYLALLRQGGFRVARILHLVYARDLATGKPVGRWLPRGVRLQYGAALQALRMNYHPRRIRRKNGALFETMRQELVETFGLSPSVFDEITGQPDYAAYADEVTPLMVNGWKDPALAAGLADLAPAAVLYTGGGIVPPSLLELPGIRFLHVHPGLLPQIRGADGLLWSMLVRGKPAASCFYLAAGIDTGDIIEAAEFDTVAFPLRAADRPGDETLYRAVFSFFDPVLRANLLMRVLLRGGDFSALPTSRQNLVEGVTFSFLNPVLRNRALWKLFPAIG